MSRESILSEVREAMTQPGFTSSIVPPLKLKFTHLASLPLYSFLCMLAECVDNSIRSNTVGPLKREKELQKTLKTIYGGCCWNTTQRWDNNFMETIWNLFPNTVKLV